MLSVAPVASQERSTSYAPPSSSVLPPHLAGDLRDQGWSLLENFLSPALVHGTRDWAERDRSDWVEPGTGKGEGLLHTGIRGDRVVWLNEGSDDCPPSALFVRLHELRQQLSRQLFLGLDEVEAHVAVYPPGKGYERHLDAFQSGNKRIISLVAYLNGPWSASDGGALRLHLPKGAYDIAPLSGRAVVFLSSQIEHEVLPAPDKERWSLAAWFRAR